MKKILSLLGLVMICSAVSAAETVYVTALTSNCTASAICGQGTNTALNVDGQPVYSDVGGSFTSAISTVPGKPPTPGARLFSNSFSNSTPDFGGIVISPTLAVTGGVYRLYHVFSSAAGNVSLDILLGVTNVAGCTLSFNSTDKFQSQYGAVVGGQNAWQFLGYVTNNLDTSTPTLKFYFQGGVVNSGAQRRLLADTFRFVLDDPCLDIPTVGVTGPLATNLPTVVVTGVSNAATRVTVYQDSGSGMVEVGSLTNGIVGGINNVPVTGLIKGAQIAATQTLGTQEGCVPASGFLIGGGANPQVRIVLSVRESTNTGPVGAVGSTASPVSGNIHFLGASTRISGAPGDGPVLFPSNQWQTVSFDRGNARIASPTNATGIATNGPGYAPNDSVSIQVYSFRTVPETGVLIYSTNQVTSLTVTSNDAFSVDWSWDTVNGAEGYRLLRNLNAAGFNDYADVFNATNLNDVNNLWIPGSTNLITPTSTFTNASVKWFSATGGTAVGTTNDLQGTWGVIDAIAFAIDDLTDTGPYDLYIDNLQNGTTVWQTFENSPAGTSDVSFRAPSFSPTTSGNIMGAPNSSTVSNGAADTGTKSLRVRFQWNGTNSSKWLRLTTSGVGNPQINLNDPTSFRILLLPVNQTPVAPSAPSISINRIGADIILNWIGAHRLQSATNVSGPYATVPSVTLAPHTNGFTESYRFFRLVD